MIGHFVEVFYLDLPPFVTSRVMQVPEKIVEPSFVRALPGVPVGFRVFDQEVKVDSQYGEFSPESNAYLSRVGAPVRISGITFFGRKILTDNVRKHFSNVPNYKILGRESLSETKFVVETPPGQYITLHEEDFVVR